MDFSNIDFSVIANNPAMAQMFQGLFGGNGNRQTVLGQRLNGIAENNPMVDIKLTGALFSAMNSPKFRRNVQFEVSDMFRSEYQPPVMQMLQFMSMLQGATKPAAATPAKVSNEEIDQRIADLEKQKV